MVLQKDVYKWFRLYFPIFDHPDNTWFPNGRNSVRIRQPNGQEFVFTYNGTKDWKLETIDSFIRRLKGEK